MSAALWLLLAVLSLVVASLVSLVAVDSILIKLWLCCFFFWLIFADCDMFRRPIGRVFPHLNIDQQPVLDWSHLFQKLSRLKYKKEAEIVLSDRARNIWSHSYKPSLIDNDGQLALSDKDVEALMIFFNTSVDCWYDRKLDGVYKSAWFVEAPCQCPYQYGKSVAVVRPPTTMPAWLLDLRQHMSEIVQVESLGQSVPNSCFVSWYQDGRASLSAHSDDEALFDPPKMDIVSLSIGSERAFEITEKSKRFKDNPRVAEHILRNMEYLTMEGDFQKHLRHRVPPYNKNCLIDSDCDEQTATEAVAAIGPRINFTWRWIRNHCDDCPVL